MYIYIYIYVPFLCNTMVHLVPPLKKIPLRKVQCLQYATVNPHVPASRSLPCCAEARIFVVSRAAKDLSNARCACELENFGDKLKFLNKEY